MNRMESFFEYVPKDLLDMSGSVFYSGRRAFQGTAPIYLLGTNPGGNPGRQANETIRWHTNKVLTSAPNDWSAYRDESWRNALPGTSGMQPRVLHMLYRLGMQSGEIPASNVVFVRSTRENTFAGNFQKVAEACWPFHEAVIESLEIRTIVCFGKTAGQFVRRKLDAHKKTGQFVEQNRRKWVSEAFLSTAGVSIVVTSHPSIADWTNSKTDPSNLVRDTLARRPR